MTPLSFVISPFHAGMLTGLILSGWPQLLWIHGCPQLWYPEGSVHSSPAQPLAPSILLSHLCDTHWAMTSVKSDAGVPFMTEHRADAQPKADRVSSTRRGRNSPLGTLASVIVFDCPICWSITVYCIVLVSPWPEGLSLGWCLSFSDTILVFIEFPSPFFFSHSFPPFFD